MLSENRHVRVCITFKKYLLASKLMFFFIKVHVSFKKKKTLIYLFHEDYLAFIFRSF